MPTDMFEPPAKNSPEPSVIGRELPLMPTWNLLIVPEPRAVTPSSKLSSAALDVTAAPPILKPEAWAEIPLALTTPDTSKFPSSSKTMARVLSVGCILPCPAAV